MPNQIHTHMCIYMHMQKDEWQKMLVLCYDVWHDVWLIIQTPQKMMTRKKNLKRMDKKESCYISDNNINIEHSPVPTSMPCLLSTWKKKQREEKRWGVIKFFSYKNVFLLIDIRYFFFGANTHTREISRFLPKKKKGLYEKKKKRKKQVFVVCEHFVRFIIGF